MADYLYSTELLQKYLRAGYKLEAENAEVAVLVRNRKIGVFWNLVLTFLSGGAWAIVWLIRILTRRSVVSLYKDSNLMPEKRVNPLNLASRNALVKFQNLSTKRKTLTVIFATAAVMAIGIAGISAGQITTQGVKNGAYNSWAKKLESQLAPSECAALSSSIENGKTISKAKTLLSKANSAAKKLSIWTAETYVSKNSWVNEATHLLNDYDTELANTVSVVLDPRVRALKDSDAANGYDTSKELWLNAFLDFAITNCKLSPLNDKSEATIRDVQSDASSIQVLAASKPWYPKGFEELPNYPGFAYKNTPTGCTYSFGNCAKFKIVSEMGCPTSLYVETNSLSNSEVVDWSNDTVPGLEPGQVALMETTFTSDLGNKWEFASIHCY